jgi:hypothetical protein
MHIVGKESCCKERKAGFESVGEARLPIVRTVQDV